MAHGDIKDSKFVKEFADSDHPDAPKLRAMLEKHEAVMAKRRDALRKMTEAQREAKETGLAAAKSALAVHDAYKRLRPDAYKIKQSAVEARRNEAYAMFRSGYRVSEIARHFGISASLASTDLHRSARRARDICWEYDYPQGIRAWGGWVWRNPPLNKES